MSVRASYAHSGIMTSWRKKLQKDLERPVRVSTANRDESAERKREG